LEYRLQEYLDLLDWPRDLCVIRALYCRRHLEGGGISTTSSQFTHPSKLSAFGTHLL
jgi:hypothetical protein